MKAGIGPAPTTPPSAGRVHSRRDFLAGMRTAWAGLLLFTPMAATVAAGPRGGAGPKTLRVPDLKIARLGERFIQQEPAAARALMHWTAEQLRCGGSFVRLRHRAAAARRRLLAPERLAREFNEEDVLLLDGWLLARSEVALAVHLAVLQRGATAESQAS